MTDQEDNIGKIVFDEDNQERKLTACSGQACFRSLIIFLSQHFCLIRLVPFGQSIFHKRVTNQLFGWEFCVVKEDTFYPHQV